MYVCIGLNALISNVYDWWAFFIVHIYAHSIKTVLCKNAHDGLLQALVVLQKAASKVCSCIDVLHLQIVLSTGSCSYSKNDTDKYENS